MDLELKSNMNCQKIRSAIDIDPTDLPSKAHLLECPPCRQYLGEMESLRALLRQQPRVEVPGDYDFHLRARIARAESKRQAVVFSPSGSVIWRTVAEWIANPPFKLALDLRGGVAAAAVAAALVVGLSFYRSSEEGTPSSTISDVASLSRNEQGTLPSPNALPLSSDSTLRKTTVAAAIPTRTPAASRNRATAIPSSTEVPPGIAAEAIAMESSAGRTDLPAESAWRVYNADRREMLSSTQQMTYLGAESSPRLSRVGGKEAVFVPSI